MKKIRCLSCLLVLFLLAGGEGPLARAADLGAVRDEFIELTVSQGDCLINLSRDYLKRPGLWSQIAELNKLSNPHQIFPGQRLRIPARFMKGTPMTGQLHYLKGTVFVSGPGTQPEKAAKIGQTLHEGQALRTGDQGVAEFAYTDGVRVLVRPKSQVSIVQSQVVHQQLWLHRIYTSIGRVVSHIRTSTGQAPRFEIKTPSAVALARGTNFRVAMDNQASMRCEVIQGRVGVQTPRRSVMVNEGQGTVVVLGQAPSAPRSLLPPPNPTDLQSAYDRMPILIAVAPVAQAFRYRVMVSRDREMRDVANAFLAPPGTSVTLEKVPVGRFFLSLRSVDPDGLEGPAFGPRLFEVIPTPLPALQPPPGPLPPAPELTTIETDSKTLKVQWATTKSDMRFRYQVSRDDQFRTIQREAIIDHRQVALSDLAPGEYYLRVQALDHDGRAGPFSTPRIAQVKTDYTLWPIGMWVLSLLLVL